MIVGLPIYLKGIESFSASDVRNRMESFLSRVNKQLAEPVDVVYIDERLSTAQAEKALKLAEVSAKNRKNMRDAHAAMVIAQSYIDSI